MCGFFLGIFTQYFNLKTLHHWEPFLWFLSENIIKKNGQMYSEISLHNLQHGWYQHCYNLWAGFLISKFEWLIADIFVIFTQSQVSIVIVKHFVINQISVSASKMWLFLFESVCIELGTKSKDQNNFCIMFHFPLSSPLSMIQHYFHQ